MKKALFLSQKGDYHAAAVKWGLAKFGVEAEIWCLSDLPDYSTVSMAFESGELKASLKNRSTIVDLSDFGFIWNRRLEKPIAPAESHENDITAIEDQSLRFAKAFRASASILKCMVNPPTAQYLSDHKSVQLQFAHSVGFNVMPTLLSNDLDEIMAFQERHSDIVHKPLSFHNWREDGHALAAYTARTPKLLEDDRFSVESMPLIYQKAIESEYEVRLICFDDEYVAGAFRNLGVDQNIDLRKSMHEHSVEYFIPEPPSEILSKCKDYLASIGLRYGAFDLIVDRNGDWWFLECNESGQFLYIEGYLPEVYALRKFCLWISDLLGYSVERDDPRLDAISLSAFEEVGGSMKALKMTSHHKSVNMIRK